MSQIERCPRPELERCNHQDADQCCGGGRDQDCRCKVCHGGMSGVDVTELERLAKAAGVTDAPLFDLLPPRLVRFYVAANPAVVLALLDRVRALEQDNASLTVHWEEACKARAWAEAERVREVEAAVAEGVENVKLQQALYAGANKGTVRLTLDQLDAILRGWKAEIQIEHCAICYRRFGNCSRCKAAAELVDAGTTVLAAALKEAQSE